MTQDQATGINPYGEASHWSSKTNGLVGEGYAALKICSMLATLAGKEPQPPCSLALVMREIALANDAHLQKTCDARQMRLNCMASEASAESQIR